MTKTLQVLVTRPAQTAHDLSRKIMEMNCNGIRFHPVIFPAIKIIDVDLTSAAVQAVIKKISDFDGVIFVSPAAIQKFQSLSHHLTPRTSLYCIGEDSYLKIKENGLGHAVFPPPPYNAETLMALPELQRVRDKNFLICQGKGGRNVILEALKKRGAFVTTLILYERGLPEPHQLPDLNAIDIVICTSELGLRNLIQLFGESIKNKKFLFSSIRLSLLGKELGLKWPSCLAKHAGDEAILEALQNETQTIAK